MLRDSIVRIGFYGLRPLDVEGTLGGDLTVPMGRRQWGRPMDVPSFYKYVTQRVEG